MCKKKGKKRGILKKYKSSLISHVCKNVIFKRTLNVYRYRYDLKNCYKFYIVSYQI